jgi:acyl dehydratase
VPEPLIAALFSYLLGVVLPGPGTNYLKQELAFLAPARPGDELTARVQITRLRPDKHLVDLWATCTARDGTLICEGRALVKARDVARGA